MVSRRAKNQAVDYVCNRLEDSGLYVIQQKDYEHIKLREDQKVIEKPSNIEIFFTNFGRKIPDIKRRILGNTRDGIYSAPILYKDGVTAFVRMVERNKSWRSDKSLKNYTEQQINQMLHLRGIEKAMIKKLGIVLPFYQPETERLPESIRNIRMTTVTFDRTHIEEDDPKYQFTQMHEDSIDYKLPVNVDTLTEAVELELTRGRGRLLAKFKECELPIVPEQDEESLFPGTEDPDWDTFDDEEPPKITQNGKPSQLKLF